MLKQKKIKFLLLYMLLVYSGSAFSQITPSGFQQYVSAIKPGESGLRNISGIKEFYRYLKYQPAWTRKENQSELSVFLADRNLYMLPGLREKEYRFSPRIAFTGNLPTLITIEDSLAAEVYITDAAIQFYHDISLGNSKPSLGYDGLKQTDNIPSLLAEQVFQKTLNVLHNKLISTLPDIILMEKMITHFTKTLSDTAFRETTIDSKLVNENNKPLVAKLSQLGILAAQTSTDFNALLKQSVREAQKMFDLPADGILHSGTLTELNTSVRIRLAQLSLSVNYYRWLTGKLGSRSVIVVNIPAAYLKVYRNNETVLEMRMIVGKKTTHTPTLASTIDQVILYPYWHVPYSIATKELLPAIKKDPGYINRFNYQLLNNAGRIIDPYTVNWKELNANHFPYTIRQSSGCDNSLGVLKLDFYNPFGVYLHDTPAKSLFMLNRRFFSHGCMRMEKPSQLGHLILKNNFIAIDTLEEKGCLRNQLPISVPADEHMSVIVWYNPAGIDSAGRVIFYGDPYRKFNWSKK